MKPTHEVRKLQIFCLIMRKLDELYEFFRHFTKNFANDFNSKRLVTFRSLLTVNLDKLATKRIEQCTGF